MKKLYFILLFCFTSEILISCKKNNSISTPVVPLSGGSTGVVPVTVLDPKPAAKTNSQKVYVHYMPWFEDQSTSGNGSWGQHWTMANQNPNIISANGRRQIAFWFYPLIGPYASSDRDVIDYHTLLMKYSGIDGVLVDWYGVHNVYDYPLIKRNTDSLFNRMPKVGLQFAICYEDATLRNVKLIAGIDTVQAAKADFTFLQSQYFGSNNYY